MLVIPFFYSRNRLENLSKTDLEQGWGKCTNAAQDEYKKVMCVSVVSNT